MLTAWGYEVDGSSLPPLLTVDDFDSMTRGRYAGDALAVSMALNAASEAVRTACGWHVSPSLECTYTAQRIGDDDPTRLVPSRLFALPSNAVTGVSSVVENGVELSEGQYEWGRDGLMRRACFECWPTDWNAVTVEYTAGLDAAAAPMLAQTVLEIASGTLAVSAGVASESADGVSVSYVASMASVASALTEQHRNALAPYRLVVAHAA